MFDAFVGASISSFAPWFLAPTVVAFVFPGSSLTLVSPVLIPVPVVDSVPAAALISAAASIPVVAALVSAVSPLSHFSVIGLVTAGVSIPIVSVSISALVSCPVVILVPTAATIPVV